MSAKRRVRKLSRRLRRKGTPEEQRARVKAHTRLVSSYVSVQDALDALAGENYAKACLAAQEVQRHSAEALETLRALDGTSE